MLPLFYMVKHFRVFAYTKSCKVLYHIASPCATFSLDAATSYSFGRVADMRSSIKRGVSSCVCGSLGAVMVNPQTEKGFLPIASGDAANDLLMPLIAAQLTGVEYQIVLLIIRKTYGFRKKEDWIALSQFVEFTGRTIQGVCKAISSLEKQRIITRRKDGRRVFYGFNKTFHNWSLLNPSLLNKSLVEITESLNSRLTNTKLPFSPSLNASLDTKDNVTKDTLTTQREEKILKWFREQDINNPAAYLSKIRKTCSEKAILKAWRDANTGSGVESPALFFKRCEYYSEQERKKSKSVPNSDS